MKSSFLTRFGALASIALLAAACGNDNGEDNNGDNNVVIIDEDTGGTSDAGDNNGTDTGSTDNNDPDPIVIAPFPPGEDTVATNFTLFPPIPTSCDQPSARYRVPFVIDTTLIRPAVIGDRINGLPLVPNRTVDIGNLFTQRSRVTPLDAPACDDGTPCPDGFRCATAGLPGAARQCVASNRIEFIPGTFQQDYDPGKDNSTQQVVTFLFENSGSLTGYVPREVGSLFDEGERDIAENPARATDPQLVSRSLAEQFIVNIASVADPQNTRMSVWWFAGDSPVFTIPLTKPDDNGDHFDIDLSVAQPRVEDLMNPSAARGTGNLNQAISRVLEKDLTLPKYADHEKFLFVFTDGPNEVYDATATDSIILDKLIENRIHLIIMHLDSEVDPTTLRDPLSYWAGSQACRGDDSCDGAPTCQSDDDCNNFETCRPATVYSEDAATPATQTPDSYCMPDYSSGRLGPSDVYADMACRTKGNYFYLPNIDELRAPMRGTPSMINGQWSVEADLSALDQAEGALPGFYRLSGLVLGLFGNTSISSKLSAPIADPDNPDDPSRASVESRPVVRVGRPR